MTVVLSAGCEIEEIPKAAVEDERQVLEETSSLAFTGDLDDITLTSDLTADGVIAGSIKETGFWNTKYTVTAGGEDWFYLGDPKDNFIYNLEGVNSGNTYEVKVQMNEGEKIDLMDKVAICRRLAYWYAFEHDD